MAAPGEGPSLPAPAGAPLILRRLRSSSTPVDRNAMNVGISCHALKFGGGMERYAMDLVDGLNALGVRPTVFAKVFDEQLPQYGRVDPVKIDLRWLPGKLRDHAFAALLKRRPERARVTTLIACNRILDADIAVCGGTHPG